MKTPFPQRLPSPLHKDLLPQGLSPPLHEDPFPQGLSPPLHENLLPQGLLLQLTAPPAEKPHCSIPTHTALPPLV